MLHLHGYFKVIPSIPILSKGKVRCRKQVASKGRVAFGLLDTNT